MHVYSFITYYLGNYIIFFSIDDLIEFCSIYICLDVLQGGGEKHWNIIGFHAFFMKRICFGPQVTLVVI